MIKEFIAKCEEKDIVYFLKSRSFDFTLLNGKFPQEVKVPLAIIDILADTKILDYRFVPDYNAVWSQEYRVVECEIETNSLRNSFFRKFFNNNLEEEKFELNINGFNVEITGPSDELTVLNLYKAKPQYIPVYNSPSRFENFREYSIVVRITDVNVETAKQAQELVETIIESLCFDVSYRFNCLFVPSVPKKRVRITEKTDFVSQELVVNNKIDKKALSYYWSAESTVGLPLICFLGYYQVVEYFYSYFSESRLRNQIANIIKDPKFDVHNYKDLNKIITANRDSFNKNKDQNKLELTIDNCVDASEFREWFESDNDRVTYFRGKNCTRVSDIKIDSKSTSELLRQARERFYAIRCRIVHTDTSNESTINISPRDDIKDFSFDIEIAKYFAQKVLIASSKSF